MIFRGQQRLVGASCMFVQGLYGGSCDMVVAGGGLFLGRRLSRRSAAAAVEADPRHARLVDDRLVVNIYDGHTAKIIDGPVVRKYSIAPVPALVTNAAISEAVIDAAV